MREDVLTYVKGFGLSVALTVGAYLLVSNAALAGSQLTMAIIMTALAQLLVQLFYFLHLGKDSQPRWNQMLFGLMMLMVFILVFGTLWIMQNLDYTHEKYSNPETDQEIIIDEGFEP
jgi:cytochrome o ubiquinol oxidase operon protein cyoD